MYQLYAYGKKYSLGNSLKKEPKLVLLYPSNPDFQNPLDEFIYDGELVLNVIPFDLKKSLSKIDEQKELTKILVATSKTLLYELQEQPLNIAAEEKSIYSKD